MRTTIKKSLCWLLALVMLLSTVAMTVVSVSAESKSWKVGDSVHAYYDETTKTLTLSGSGATYDYRSAEDATNVRGYAPWYNEAMNDKIEHVVVTPGVTRLGDAIFYRLNMCKSYSLPITLREIGMFSFAHNTALYSIALPSSLQLIEKWAFYSSGLANDYLKNSTCAGTPTVEWGSGTNKALLDDLDAASLAKLQIDASGSLKDLNNEDSGIIWQYSNATQTLTLTNALSDTVVMPDLPSSGSGAPWDIFRSRITRVVIGDKIKNVGANAFLGMTSITSVTLGQQVESLDSKCFAGCTGLTSLQLPQATTKVEANVFSARAGRYISVSTPNTQASMLPGCSLVGNDAVSWTYGTFTPPTSGGSTSTTNAYGTINGQINWTYTALSGTLSLSLASGVTSAAIPDYTNFALTPWAQNGLNASVTSLSIGTGITRVGSYAFAGMSKLQLISLGSSVQSIGTYAFANNVALPMISLPASLQWVEPNAFTGCSALYFAQKSNQSTAVYTPNAELLAALNYGGTGTYPGPGTTPGTGSTITGNIPGTSLTWSYSSTTKALNITGVGAIPSYTSSQAAPWKSYASSITAITVQSGITSIGNNAFADMTAVTDVYLPNGLTSIGSSAFSGCTSLKNISLPSSLTSIGASAFRNCYSLASVDIPDGVTEISDYTFANCLSLKSVTLPERLTRIGVWAFYGCKALTYVDFPATLLTIGDEAFYGCSALTGVLFRSPSLSIGVNAFQGCNALLKAVCVSTQPTAASGNEALVSKFVSRYGSGTNGNVSWEIDRASGVLTLTGNGAATLSNGWKDELPFATTLVFGNGITSIGAGLLQGDKYIEQVVMSDVIISVGNSAFEGCENLQTVTFSDNLSSLGVRAFYNCPKLTSVELPKTLTQIPDEAFTSCTSLSSLTLGSKTTSIGINAFNNCTALTEVVIPETVTTISSGAFANDTALTKITLSGGTMSTLPAGIFTGSTALRSVYFNGTQSQWVALSANADAVIKNAIVAYCVTATVHYEYKGGPLDGQTVKPSDSFIGATGEVKQIIPEEAEHYTPTPSPLTIAFTNTDQIYYVYYMPKQYTVTVRFIDAETGEECFEPEIYTVEYTKSLVSPIYTNKNGYTLDRTQVVIDSVTGNQTVEIKCTKNDCTYVVEYVNEITEEVIFSETKTAKYGEKVTVTPPATLDGYTIKNANGSYSIAEIKDNDQKITVVYTPKYETFTIHYVDKDGNKVADDYTDYVYYGKNISVTSPVLEGKTPDKATVSIAQYAGEKEITVTYDWTYYTVTVHFVEKDSIGYAIYDDFTATVKHGDTFTFDLSRQADYPTPAAYVTDVTVVNFGTVTEDMEKTITYSRKNLTLTVNYTDANGNVLDTDLYTVPAGTVYTVEAKEIEGYFATEQTQHTMGTVDETLNIELELDPESPVNQPKNNAGKVILVIVVIVLVLVTGGALFYFLYLKKKPY